MMARTVLPTRRVMIGGTAVAGTLAAMTSRPGLSRMATLDDGVLADGYCDQRVLDPGDTAVLRLNAHRPVRGARLAVRDVLGRLVDVLVADVVPQERVTDRPYELGYRYRHAVPYVVPAGLPSGAYTVGEQAVLLVRGTPGSSRPLVVVPLSTVQAYDKAGGKSLYVDADTGRSQDRAYRVSFARPLDTWGLCDARQALRWLAHQGVEADITTDCDLRAEDLAGRRLVVLVGHSEYWTRPARALFDAFVDRGGNALVLSGNTMWWQSRVTSDQLVCYREAPLDPLGATDLATVLWAVAPASHPPEESVGVSFVHGGYSRDGISRRALTVVAPRHPLLDGVLTTWGDGIRLVSTANAAWQGQAIEYDGAPVVLDRFGVPAAVEPGYAERFHRIDLVAYDDGWRAGPTRMTVVDLHRTATGGRIINFANNVMGRSLTHGADAARLGRMVHNALDLLA